MTFFIFSGLRIKGKQQRSKAIPDKQYLSLAWGHWQQECFWEQSRMLFVSDRPWHGPSRKGVAHSVVYRTKINKISSKHTLSFVTLFFVLPDLAGTPKQLAQLAPKTVSFQPSHRKWIYIPCCFWNRTFFSWPLFGLIKWKWPFDPEGEVTFNDLYIRAVMAIPFGLKSLIMPFGLTNAPVRFQQPMAKDPILVLW